MSDTTVLLGSSEVDSIVLGAAENEARRLGFTISASTAVQISGLTARWKARGARPTRG